MREGYFKKYNLTSDDAIILDDVAIHDARAREEPVTEVLLIEARRQVEFVQILKKDKKGELDIECLAKIQSQQTFEDEIYSKHTSTRAKWSQKRPNLNPLWQRKKTCIKTLLSNR